MKSYWRSSITIIRKPKLESFMGVYLRSFFGLVPHSSLDSSMMGCSLSFPGKFPIMTLMGGGAEVCIWTFVGSTPAGPGVYWCLCPRVPDLSMSIILRIFLTMLSIAIFHEISILWIWLWKFLWPLSPPLSFLNNHWRMKSVTYHK